MLADDNSFPEINEIPRSRHILNHPSRQYLSLLERNISRLQFATQILLRNYTAEQFELLKELVNQIKKNSNTHSSEPFAVTKCLGHVNCVKHIEFLNYKQQKFKRISSGKFHLPTIFD